MSDNFDNLMSKLLKLHSFSLQKISPTTYPDDVIVRHKKHKDLPVTEFPGILSLIKSGSAFRCRIGKNRYWYAETAAEAIEKALKGEKREAAETPD